MNNCIKISNDNNSLYYNKMLRASERKKVKKPLKQKSFASRKVDFSKYLIVFKGYETIAYVIYFLLIPYLMGLTFLFFYVAKAAYASFTLLDLSSFLIVWAIGYEITGAIILIFITISFIKHLKSTSR